MKFAAILNEEVILKELLIIVLAFLLIMSYGASAHSEDYPKFKVRVNITAPDNLEGSITSYIKRELQKLHDVEIVENDSDYVLVILVVEITNKSGETTGVSMSILILEKFHNQFLDVMIDEKSKFKDFFLAKTSDLFYKPKLKVQIGATSDAESICAEIVANFDNQHLVEIRNARRLEQEIFKK